MFRHHKLAVGGPVAETGIVDRLSFETIETGIAEFECLGCNEVTPGGVYIVLAVSLDGQLVSTKNIGLGYCHACDSPNELDVG